MTRSLLFSILLVLLCAAAGPAQSGPAADHAKLPILFVHGNGDDAARWVPTIWLFESNGYPADRLFAIRFTKPSARTDDTQAEPFRSSTVDAAAELASEVTRILIQTHSSKVILVGSSRGGLTMRNYLQNGGGAPNVAAAILCGTPNHGVLATDANLGGEFNGKGTFLAALNKLSPQGTETVSGVRMMTLRSDKLDKFAQSTGIALGQPAMATGITFDGPALKGATNLVLAGEDHRELAFSRDAFAKMFEFITGNPPQSTEVLHEQHPGLSGVITSYAGGVPTNQPLSKIHLRIYSIVANSPQDAPPIYETTTKADGHWGPFAAMPGVEYEFDLEGQDNIPMSGEASGTSRHVRYFVASLPRSSTLWNLRFLPAPKEEASSSGMFLVSRPEGYFSRERDPVTIDGGLTDEEPAGLPLRDSFVVHRPLTENLATVTLRKETLRIKASSNLALDLPVAYLLW